MVIDLKIFIILVKMLRTEYEPPSAAIFFLLTIYNIERVLLKTN